MATQESLAQYQWRFRVNAIRGAYENSVSMNRVKGGLNRLGLVLDSPSHPLGPDVTIGVCDHPPEGTVVYSGSPDRPHELGIHVWRDGVWATVFGAPPYNMVTVVSVPGRGEDPPAWLTTPGDESDVNLIKMFKARAWKIGHRVQQEASWCPTFDRVMAQVDVSASSVTAAGAIRHNGWAVGDMLASQSDAQQLPSGTVLFWNGTEGDEVRFMVSVRDDTMRNKNESWCRRIVAKGTTGNFRTGCIIASFPDGVDDDPADWNIRVTPVRQWLPELPPGVFFTIDPEAHDGYTTCDDGMVAPGRESRVSGPYTPGQFSTYNYIYLMGYVS